MSLTSEQKQIKKMQHRFEMQERHQSWLRDDFERLESWLIGLTSKLKVSKVMAKPIPVVVPYRRLIGPQRAARNRRKPRCSV